MFIHVPFLSKLPSSNVKPDSSKSVLCIFGLLMLSLLLAVLILVSALVLSLFVFLFWWRQRHDRDLVVVVVVQEVDDDIDLPLVPVPFIILKLVLRIPKANDMVRCGRDMITQNDNMICILVQKFRIHHDDKNEIFVLERPSAGCFGCIVVLSKYCRCCCTLCGALGIQEEKFMSNNGQQVTGRRDEKRWSK